MWAEAEKSSWTSKGRELEDTHPISKSEYLKYLIEIQGVIVWIIQRNITHRRCIYSYGGWESQDLWSKSWRPGESCSVVSDSLRPHGRQHARLPCPSLSPRVCSNSCPLSQWCYPTISSSVTPFSSLLQSFPASGSFPVSQFFHSGVQRIGASASASVLPMNIQNWFPLGWTSLISLLSKGLARVFSSTTVQKRQFGLPWWLSGK